METQPQTDTPRTPTAPVSTKKEPVTEFTVFELETIHQVINARGNAGAGIKDLRLLSSVAKKVKSYIPERLEPPKQPTGNDQEAKTAYMQAVKDWQKSLEDRVDQVITTDFTGGDMMVIKNKIRSFGGFSTDEEIRERLVVLFDKLDIQ